MRVPVMLFCSRGCARGAVYARLDRSIYEDPFCLLQKIGVRESREERGDIVEYYRENVYSIGVRDVRYGIWFFWVRVG